MSGYVHYDALAYRLILAQLADDQHAIDIIGAEFDGCAHCWRNIAEHLAANAADDLLGEFGTDAAAIKHTEEVIAHDLDSLARWTEQDGVQP